MSAPSTHLPRTFALATESIEMTVTDYGGRIVSLRTPDRNGQMDDIVLGFDNLTEYYTDTHYFGALIGRYANRIARGRFCLDGRECQVITQPSGHALHGGSGFHSKRWHIETEPRALRMSYTSLDSEDGFPGTLSTTVTYALTDHELRIDYAAACDCDTVINLTNHSYFNLSALRSATILDHELQLHAERFTPVDAGLIPTGELRSVAGTPFDFRRPRRIGERIEMSDEQLAHAGGYDHNWVLAMQPSPAPRLAAEVYEPRSGRVLSVLTTEPGLQFYSGNFLDGPRGKHALEYGRRAAFCLETQHFPDSPNQPRFPSTVLRANTPFQSTTLYRCATRR